MTIVTGVALLALYLYVGSLLVRRLAEEWWFYQQIPTQPIVLVTECAAWPLMCVSAGMNALLQPAPTLTKKHFEA